MSIVACVSLSVSVIVVSYNTKDKLRRCLSCLEAEHEVIVIDNASSDGSAEMVAQDFPAVRLIRNAQNVGFGAANNQGEALAGGELLLFLNSDAYASPGAVEVLTGAFRDASVVAAGGMLLNPDETLQESVAARLTLWMVFLEQTLLDKLASRLGLGYWRTRRALEDAERSRRFAPGDEPLPGMARVSQVMGASLMVRKGLESFDERFFLYCEDTDLCLRLRRHGEIVYVPDAHFVHDLGSSSYGPNRWLGVARYNRGKEIYFRLHHGRLSTGVCWLLNRFGALLRLALWLLPSIFLPSKRSSPALFLRVLTAPVRGPKVPIRKAE